MTERIKLENVSIRKTSNGYYFVEVSKSINDEEGKERWESDNFGFPTVTEALAFVKKQLGE